MSDTRLIPLQQWICDSCGETISSVQEGQLEWIQHKDRTSLQGFRIVHLSGCHYQEDELQKMEISEHTALQDCVGSKGLVKLFGLLESKNYVDRTEIMDLIRRLHIHYYEEARLYWPRAIQEDIIANSSSWSNYDPDFLLELIRYYNRPRDFRRKGAY
ncbi:MULTISPECIES: hypothetical protein [Paenibacillus]|uniref:hypothetical protein n=1 Tax=Paenibacillus TaxID=44249 RepID=UPI0022B9047C|nr:hypothetical protein [Paenibacillus caseinilyticus]MCZ8521141.1 hypothetical protein [Paenibacillus caseinilyticus]